VTEFTSLKIVGDLLSSDLLGRIFAGDQNVPGTPPTTYGLEPGESPRRQASRSWAYLLEVWQDEKKRDRWTRILLRELGFPQQMPSHIAFRALGWDVDLDHRTPHREARAPQSVMQELLNRDDSRLWGILCNGVTLRLLRDSATLVGSAYVEFDLAAIFDGELFSDFVLLYLVCHESRFAVQGNGGPESCYLEQWRAFAAVQGDRALDQLRTGVTQAISILGTGFISHRDNPQLRHRLGNDELRLDDLNRALLRLVYRILFWFVAEDRDALLIPDVSAETPDAIARNVSAETRARLREARDRYHQFFSAARLRHLARQQRGTRHTDLFEAVQLVFDALGSEGGVPELALPGIGGIFESRRDDGTALALDEPLAGARLSNEALLGAVRTLALIRPRDGGAMRRVDFGNLGAEELGSVYESLLELIPHYDPDNRSYTLTVLPGNERKESGSYYTPTSLVECLLDSALDPLLDEATARGTAEDKIAALLDLTVCDPACGSGHFLVAAARRIAKRIAAEETGESEPPEPEIRKALRRVVGRCIYGVDINPMAAELAKVSLWLEALEPGKPLSYLDQNIRVGNSLLGVTPALLADGLPDAAFTPIEGDDRKVCAALKKQNAVERQGQHDLFSQSGIPVSNAVLAKRSVEITRTLPESLEDLHIHQRRQAEQLAASSERRIQKLLADAWCAAFVQRKTDVTRSIAITHAVLENFGADDSSLNLAAAERLVTELTRQYRFFHWHVEFPHIFRVGNGAHDPDPATGWSGGFSCVIGNPPWEKVELNEQEFFVQRNPKIAKATNAATRKKLIAELADSNPTLHSEFAYEQRTLSGWAHLLKETGRYPLTARGRLNTYAVFAETARMIVTGLGQSGLVLPTGIATDATTAAFFGDLVRNARLVSIFDFENEGFLLSRAVHHAVRFCLLTFGGRATHVKEASFAFGTRYMRDLPERQFAMPPEEILLVNPNTGTAPVFRSRRDAEITIEIYKRVPVLLREDPE
jgi:N-6 DNA Methylase